MGMRGHLRQITPFELKRFQLNPKTVRTAILGKKSENQAAFIAALQRMEPLADRVERLNLNAEEQKRAQEEIFKEIAAVAGGFGIGGGRNELDLEKSWHVLHYLLTGRVNEAPPPLGNAILGGTEIGEDLGYGPARFLSPGQVREVAVALAAISKKDLADRFNLEAIMLAHVYPVRDESELELAQQYFEDLSEFYADTAASGNAMLLYIA